MEIYKIQTKSSYTPITKENFVSLNYNELDSEYLKLNKVWHLQRYGFPLSRPEFLNYLTHRQAWREFLKSDQMVACFIEDHLSVNINYSEVEESISMLDEDWHVFFPYNSFNNNPNEFIKTNSLQLLNPNISEMEESEPYYLGLCWGASIYFLSKSGAEYLINIENIKQRVEDEMFYQNENNNLGIYFDEFDWLDINEHSSYIPTERLENINEAVLNYNTWQPEAKGLAKRILHILGAIGKSSNIDLILQGGSHLGYVRHGGIMPWDDDIDIGIEELHIDRFLEALSAYPEIQVKQFIEYTTGAVYYKIWSNNGKIIQSYEWTFPFIDLWLFNRVGDDFIFKNGIICPNSNKEGLIEINFEGAILKIPFNSIECLNARYTDWKTCIRIYPYSHQEEKGRTYRLKTAINVDMNGRIIAE